MKSKRGASLQKFKMEKSTWVHGEDWVLTKHFHTMPYVTCLSYWDGLSTRLLAFGLSPSSLLSLTPESSLYGAELTMPCPCCPWPGSGSQMLTCLEASGQLGKMISGTHSTNLDTELAPIICILVKHSVFPYCYCSKIKFWDNTDLWNGV